MSWYDWLMKIVIIVFLNFCDEYHSTLWRQRVIFSSVAAGIEDRDADVESDDYNDEWRPRGYMVIVMLTWW